MFKKIAGIAGWVNWTVHLAILFIVQDAYDWAWQFWAVVIGIVVIKVCDTLE